MNNFHRFRMPIPVVIPIPFVLSREARFSLSNGFEKGWASPSRTNFSTQAVHVPPHFIASESC